MTLEKYADIYVKQIDENRYAVYFCYNLQETVEETMDEEGNTVQKPVYEGEAFGKVVSEINQEELKKEYKRIAEMYNLESVVKPKLVQE